MPLMLSSVVVIVKGIKKASAEVGEWPYLLPDLIKFLDLTGPTVSRVPPPHLQACIDCVRALAW